MNGYIKLVIFFWTYVFSSLVYAGDAEMVEKNFKAYWTEFSLGQFYSASQFVSPEDLERVRNAFVPVFLNASKSMNSSVRQQADIFFGSIPIELRPSILSRDAYAGMGRAGFAPSPNLLDLLRRSTVRINKVQFTSKEEATLYYSVKFPNGYERQDTEQFKRTGGLWLLRLKLVEENAAKTRMALDKFDHK